MKRFGRLVLGVLMLNLSLTGGDAECAHEEPVTQASAVAHDHGVTAERTVPPSGENRSMPCQETEAMCCEAIASCAVSGVPEGGSSVIARMFYPETVASSTLLRPDNAAPEVATPPPRRA